MTTTVFPTIDELRELRESTRELRERRKLEEEERKRSAPMYSPPKTRKQIYKKYYNTTRSFVASAMATQIKLNKDDKELSFTSLYWPIEHKITWEQECRILEQIKEELEEMGYIVCLEHKYKDSITIHIGYE